MGGKDDDFEGNMEFSLYIKVNINQSQEKAY